MLANTNSCEVVAVHCFDFRLQDSLNNWLTTRFGVRNYDRVSWAGGVKDYGYIEGQIDLAHRFHKIKKVILINHEDCAAYGVAGTWERHINDLADAERRIKLQYPDLAVEKYFLHLNGTFELIE